MATATQSKPKSSGSGKRRTRGFEVVRWIEAHCVHTNGRWIGQPFKLLDWQKKFILRLFEVDEADLRVKRWAYLSVAKKNGKTELAAALALYFLIGDGEPAPLVVCAAGSDEQADLVFGAAKTMASMSPTLQHICECFDKEILVPSIPGAKLKRVAAVAGTNDGQNIHAVICDELHEWTGPKGEKVWDVLTNGIIGRSQGMVLQITTAGYDIDTVCGRQYERGKAIAKGEIDDPTYLFEVYEATPEDDHREEATWRKGNPSYGVLVHKPQILDQLSKKTESVFRRYFCNTWTTAQEAWLPFGAWERCAGRHDWKSKDRIVLGFDGSYSGDSTALVACSMDGHLEVVGCWEKPEGNDDWRVDILEVEKTILEACKNFEVVEVACDPYRWQRTMQVLEAEGVPIVEWPTNSPGRMVPACARFYDAVVDGKLSYDPEHEHGERLARHVANCVVKTDRFGPRIVKEHKMSRRRIDLAVAAVIAFDRAMQPQEEPATAFFMSLDED